MGRYVAKYRPKRRRRAKRKRKARRHGQKGFRRDPATLRFAGQFQILPQRFVLSHRYVGGHATTLGVAGGGGLNGWSSWYNYSPNDARDPQKTGASHQPYGWDQMSSLYASFKVLRCRAKIEVFLPMNYPPAGQTFLFSCIDQDSVHTPASITQGTEGALAIVRELKSIDVKCCGGAANAGRKIVGYFDYTPKSWDRAIPQDQLATLKQDYDTVIPVANSPARLAFFSFALMNAGQETSLESIMMQMTLQYTIEWSDPIEIGAS